jgi:hypothetical protein
MSLYASWIHGNALVAEGQQPNDDSITSFTHYGWGTVAKVKAERSVWFHIPIPTPFVIDGKRSLLQKFFLLYKTTGPGRIEYIHLWDGARKVPFSGNYPGTDGRVMGAGEHLGIDQESTFDLAQSEPTGVGFNLSINAHAGTLELELMIAAAGGDFWRPIN